MNTDSDPFSFAHKILLLRTFRLRHMPTAYYAAKLMSEAGLPVLAVEFGNVFEKKKRVLEDIPRYRIPTPWAALLPRKLRSSAIFFRVLSHLILKIVVFGKPKLMITHGLPESCLALALHRLFKIPFISHVHEVLEKASETPFNRWLMRFEGSALRQAEFLIFPEQGRAAAYRQRYHFQQAVYIAYNCPLRRRKQKTIDLRTQYRLSQQSLLMAYVGGIGETNALMEAIEAVASIPNLYFFLAGWAQKDYLELLKQKAATLKTGERVFFLGEIEDKWSLLDNVDILYCVYRPLTLRTKHLATASNKLTEAMAAGLPVITTSNPDFKEIIDKYDIGICVKEIAPDDIAQAVQELCKPGEIMRKSRNASHCHSEVFNYEQQFAPIMERISALFGNEPDLVRCSSGYQ
ncbi:MAG: glycosyltransferase [Deltaproteobacteria bacterium]|nr:glycosyltransferase [Deltaproteobacteria bacterium]